MPTSNEAFVVFLYLLPGFIGLIVYELVAEVPRREALDRVIAALALTVTASTIQYLFFGASILSHVGKPATEVMNAWRELAEELGWTGLTAALCGLMAAITRNRRWINKAASCLGIARRTGAIDVWHQVFSGADGKWIRLRYKDGAILIGWPKYYSEDSKTMMLFLAKAAWHMPSKEGAPENTLTEEVVGSGVLITNFTDVRGIEVLD